MSNAETTHSQISAAEEIEQLVEPLELSPIFGDGLKDQAAAVWV